MSIEQINQSGLICLNIQPCINKATGLKTKRTVRKHEHNTFARWIKLLQVFFSKTKASNVICDDLGRGHSLCNATPRPRDIGLPKTKHPFLNSFTASSTVVQSFFQKFFLYRCWVYHRQLQRTQWKQNSWGSCFCCSLIQFSHPRYVCSAEIYTGYSYYLSSIPKDYNHFPLLQELCNPHTFPVSVINPQSYPTSIHFHKRKEYLRKHQNISNYFI